MKFLRKVLNHYLIDIKLQRKYYRKVVVPSFPVFIYCIINFIKYILDKLDHIYIIIKMHDDKICETCRIKYANFKDDLTEYKCLWCKKNYQKKKKINEKLKKTFFSKFKFSNHDIDMFVLLLWKSVYPYKYMDDWENSMKHHYLNKKIFTIT